MKPRKDKYDKKIEKYLIDYEDEQETYGHDEEREVEQSEDEAGNPNKTV